MHNLSTPPTPSTVQANEGLANEGLANEGDRDAACSVTTSPQECGHAEVGPVDHLSAFCPRYQRAMDMVGRRWAGVILRVLLGGPRRFNELLAAIPGISDRLLTERLRELEAEGVLERHVLPGPPVRVEYSLTAKGQELEGVIRALSAWAERWVTLEHRAGTE